MSELRGCVTNARARDRGQFCLYSAQNLFDEVNGTFVRLLYAAFARHAPDTKIWIGLDVFY